MTRTVVFKTPGLIDVRAFTAFGVSSKPNSASPIGFFGTGLKYAVAVLVRAGAEPSVWIGRDRHTFSTKSDTFRGKSFDFIRLERRRWALLRSSFHTLPFTTEYGKNWKMWQALRELESNTRDECGETFVLDAPASEFRPDDDRHTHFVVEHPDFAEAYAKIDEIFLPKRQDQEDLSEIVEIFGKRSPRLYYRDLRALDITKKTLRTYNFLRELDLTEDRTIKYEFFARSNLAEHLARSENHDLIEEVLTCGEEYWEHGLEFPSHVAPSQPFREVVARRANAVSRTTYGYYAGHTPRVHRPPTLWEASTRPWRLHSWKDVVLDAHGRDLFAKPEGVTGDWRQLAESMVDLVNAKAPEDAPEEAPTPLVEPAPDEPSAAAIDEPAF